ncbi:MAG: SH3 domain-containing protein [Rhizobiaceae bacterium]|nr:SH3 domain-containing protein [Rhizobiaceae bacterium]MCV0405876.1 SH3 domain-containing protein [Rhizobiaceae bacterium]
MFKPRATFTHAVLAGVLSGLLAAAPLPAAAVEVTPIKTSEGASYLLISGEFVAGERPSELIALASSANPLAVTFDSPGGSVEAAMRYGRAIRALGLLTIQPRSSECSSACALAFLGGQARFAESGAIGVHRNSFSEGIQMSADEAVVATQLVMAATMQYIEEMGANPSLLQVAMQYDSADMRYLSLSEMSHFRVITADDEPAKPPASPPVASVPPTPPSQAAAPRFEIPTARSGRVRHPKGNVVMRSAPGEQGKGIATFSNGESVAITGSNGRWYQVATSKGRGFMHDTWILVDQFDSGSFHARHIQIKSLGTYAEAESYVRSHPLRVAAYLATNGWFAITLEDTFDAATGAALLKSLKSQGQVPDDSYMSYGNTYVRKVCCER